MEKISADDYCGKIIERINAILEQNNIKQLDLANRCKISQSSLSKLLKGEMRMTLQHIFNICMALHIQPEDLLSLGKNCSDDLSDMEFTLSDNTGLFNEQYINEQIMIRDKNHPAFNGFKNNTFYIYLYSTISSESCLLDGTLSFSTQGTSFCQAQLVLNTGRLDINGSPVQKIYSGEMIISLTMGACYCVLTNPEIGEICFLNFKHMFLFNRDLECRVGIISSTSSGGNRLPVTQRILLSKRQLHVKEDDPADLEFVQGQLRLNNAKILVSKNSLDALQKKYADNAKLTEFFQSLQGWSVPEEYYLLDEANIKNLSAASDIKAEGLGILRNLSAASKYNKVSTKTDEFTFEYICHQQIRK